MPLVLIIDHIIVVTTTVIVHIMIELLKMQDLNFSMQNYKMSPFGAYHGAAWGLNGVNVS